MKGSLKKPQPTRAEVLVMGIRIPYYFFRLPTEPHIITDKNNTAKINKMTYTVEILTTTTILFVPDGLIIMDSYSFGQQKNAKTPSCRKWRRSFFLCISFYISLLINKKRTSHWVSMRCQVWGFEKKAVSFKLSNRSHPIV